MPLLPLSWPVSWSQHDAPKMSEPSMSWIWREAVVLMPAWSDAAACVPSVRRWRSDQRWWISPSMPMDSMTCAFRSVLLA